MKLSKNVGKNCYPNSNDVIILQTCFSKIKMKTKFGMKPVWPGKIDGKNSKDLVCAIENFQASENLKITGKIETFGSGWSKVKQKAPNNIHLDIVKNAVQLPTSSGEKKYEMKSGVKLSPEIEKKVAKIANAYHAITNKKLLVNSGTRTPETQASAMFGNIEFGKIAPYKNQVLRAQIQEAYDFAISDSLSNRGIISAMAKTIAKQVAKGQYISKHLIARGVDISVKGMTTFDRSIFKEAAQKVASTVILETGKNEHWHLQF